MKYISKQNITFSFEAGKATKFEKGKEVKAEHALRFSESLRSKYFEIIQDTPKSNTENKKSTSKK